MSTQENQIRKEMTYGPILVAEVKEDNYSKGVLKATLKQTVTIKSYYPTKSVSNSLQDNIFETADFGITEEERVNTETRVSWIPVPANSTIESVTAALKNFHEANIYKILSNHPILTDSDQRAIDGGLISKEMKALKQIVRFGKDHTETPLQIIKVNGKPMYRETFFSKQGSKDIDNRTETPNDFFTCEEISEELGLVEMLQEERIL